MEFEIVKSVIPHDDTTLFCCSGMQQYKSKFKDQNYKCTISNIQPCIRLNDLEEIGDSTHFLYFNMMGFFSFREWTVKRTIDFWMSFINKIGLKVDYVTIHPDKKEWKDFYIEYNVEVKEDLECTWTDGDLGGYCTEFYVNGIEIGNIVNCNGDCIDVGFGLERLDMLVNNKTKDEISVLKETIEKIIESGYVPGPKQQGYILRKLLRLLYVKGGSIDHEFFVKEKERQERLVRKYSLLKQKHKDKSKEWWYGTHGIDLNEMGP